MLEHIVGYLPDIKMIDAIGRMPQDITYDNLITYPKALLRLTIVIINNMYCIPTYVIWMTLLLPVKHVNPNLYYKIEGLFFHWLLSIVAMWSWSAGYDIVELGDDITPCRKKEARTLVIANHQSTADVPLMMACFNAKPDVLPNIMWIMDRLFKYTNFGIVSLIHQDYFITSGRSTRTETIVNLKKHLTDSFIPRNRNWMVLFPEGGFLRKRREISQRFAARNNLPALENVSLPRVGALKAIFECMPPRTVTQIPVNNNSSVKEPVICTNGINGQLNNVQPMNGTLDPPSEPSQVFLDYILDITIAYPDGKPLDIPNIVHGLRDPCQTYFLYRLYHTSEVPNDEESLTKWLFDRWSEKEEILKEFYATGISSLPGINTAMIVQQDMLRFLIINLFFITSTYVHIRMFSMFFDYYNLLIYNPA